MTLPSGVASVVSAVLNSDAPECMCRPDWLQTVVENDGVILLNYTNLVEFPCKRLCTKHCKLARTFYAKRNLLQRLPADLPLQYPAITELYLPSNQILCLPGSLGELRELRNLNVSDNQIEELPQTLTRLSNLEQLCIRHNALQKLPANIGDLENLMILDVSYNELTSLPCSIHKCTHLNQLLISHNNLTSLPRHICLLKELEQLSVTSNRLLYLPVDLGVSESLSVVELENNCMLQSCPSHLLPKLCYYTGCAQKQLSNSAMLQRGFHGVGVAIPGNPMGDIPTVLSCPKYVQPCCLAVPSLREVASRTLNLHGIQGAHYVSLWKDLPRAVYNRMQFPIGHCYHCSGVMFWSCIVKLKSSVILVSVRPSISHNNMLFVSYFCSYSCALLG